MIVQNTAVETEKREILKRYRNLLKACRRTLEKGDKELIRKAFNMALEAHSNMRRKTGEPYIYHPLAVAQICAEEIGLGTTSIVCALLHDTVEDTHLTISDIKLGFGEKVAEIIDGLTKISGVFDNHNASIQAENFRKMLLTLSKDVRVILIKLADRLHNMRTLDSMSKKNQIKISSETLYLYAPLAHRLGLYNLKTELEDLSIKYTDSDKYFEIAQKLQDSKLQRNKYIKSFVEPINEELESTGYQFEIKGRPKSIFSILQKMQKQDIPFEEVYDLFAVRIIMDVPLEEEKAACWAVYSIVTDYYYPNPDRLRDWISSPKSNGYESLHTTVMGPKGRWVEVQIRTKRMNEIAEKGYAAHWKYKEEMSVDANEYGLEEWLASIREILENPNANAIDFLDDFKLNLFADEVFVFTPTGELKKLPMGATALDFAFEIHSDLGSHCIGAKINNKLVPINHVLSNGDQVEIITSKKQKVNEEWTKFVVTAKAKSKIKHLLKEEKRNIAQTGKEYLERKFKNAKITFSNENINKVVNFYQFQSSLDFFYAIAKDDIDKSKIDVDFVFHRAPHLNEEKEQGQKVLESERTKPTRLGAKENVLFGDKLESMQYSFARCCNPIPGDEITGFVTVGEGIKVHRTNCHNAIKLAANYGYRIIKAQWIDSLGNEPKRFVAGIKITGIDDVGVISKITDAISKQHHVNMKSITVVSNEGTFEGKIELFIQNTNQLDSLIKTIKIAVPLTNVVRSNLAD